MPSTYKSIPVFLSGFAMLTGYQCPSNKTAIIKQISVSNETTGTAYIDVKWEDYNAVGIGTSSSNSLFSTYPVSISGLSFGLSTVKLLEDFVSIGSNDTIILRTPNTGRANVILTIIENDILN